LLVSALVQSLQPRARLPDVSFLRSPVSDAPISPPRSGLAGALRDAFDRRLGVPPSLEPVVREFSRARRLEGVAIEKVLIEVKQLIREETGDHAPLFTPRVVGWAVAGYFAGTGRASGGSAPG
jgi:hypothetical protein